MTFRDDEIQRQLRLGEDSDWEFKQVEFTGNRPTSPRRDDLADEIAAFANASGGVLLCGVTDSGDVQGLSRPQMDSLERLLVEICSDSITPSLTVRILRRELDGNAFLMVDVPAGQARFLCFDKQPVPDTGLGTLEPSLWTPLLSAEGRADPGAALEKMGLLGRDENGTVRATVAGVLFCSHSPEEWLPNACITATHYRGADRASGQLDAQTITGPLNRQIAEAVAFAVRNMRVGAYKDPARMELPQYSAEALFEAIANAVVHRDYSMRGSRIRLSMFADRMEIQSPGALANSLTVDELEYRQATRNEVLASVLGRMPTSGIQGAGGRLFIMERRGDGVPVIRRETRELAGRLPQFDLVGDADLCVTLPAASTEPSPARVLITVRADDWPLGGAQLLVLFPNKTWKQATTDAQGEAMVGLHTVDLPMIVFVAADGFAAHCEREWTPAEGVLAVGLKPLPDGGAVIFPEDGGQIPGLQGRLDPIRDTLDRTYLYASNIAINEGRQQPVHFVPGEELRLTDAAGREMLIRILEIVGRSALVEYHAGQEGEK